MMRVERPIITEPAQIEMTSMAIIESYLQELNLGDLEKVVYKRIIHTAGDPELVNLIKLSSDFAKRSVGALKIGATIVTDVQMVKAGINKKNLKLYDNKVLCEIQNQEVAVLAKQLQTTRSAAAVNYLKAELQDSIFVVGNAPTALYEILRISLEEDIRPAAIIGVPVGFVGAAESKELLISLETELKTRNIAWASLEGTKGGSAIAASIINALLILSTKGETDV